MGAIGTQICELKSVLRISRALQPNNFWTISSAFNHCGCKKWSLTLRWGRDTQSFVVCRAHSGQHKSNWTLVEDVETFFASENPEQYISTEPKLFQYLLLHYVACGKPVDVNTKNRIHKKKILQVV